MRLAICSPSSPPSVWDHFYFFFFSSRRRHTRLTCDLEFRRVLFRSLGGRRRRRRGSWLRRRTVVGGQRGRLVETLQLQLVLRRVARIDACGRREQALRTRLVAALRSEKRRVGGEGRGRGSRLRADRK